MKKWMYLLSGVVIGAIVATSGSAFAAQVKSLIGQKVTGEYTVVVNGKTLQDKGTVVGGKTNAPVRALSEALGADLKVDGKTITVNTESTQGEIANNDDNSVKFDLNNYSTWDKRSLEERKNSLENKILKPTNEGREHILSEIELAKHAGMNGEPAPNLVIWEKQLKEYDQDIAKYTKELEQVNAALAAIK